MASVLELALLLAVALAPPVVLAIRLRNAERHRREPWRVLWRAFAWGSFVAAALAIVVESALEPVLGRDRLLLAAFPVFLVVVAPLVEELVKALGLRLIDDHNPEPEDGYIYGGAVGLGFAATENVFYIVTAFLFAGEDLAFATALYRGVATVALHGAASAMAGYGIWKARYGGVRIAALWGILLAIGLHVAYNALASMSLPWATIAAAGLAILAYLRIMRRVVVLDDRGAA